MKVQVKQPLIDQEVEKDAQAQTKLYRVNADPLDLKQMEHNEKDNTTSSSQLLDNSTEIPTQDLRRSSSSLTS